MMKSLIVCGMLEHTLIPSECSELVMSVRQCVLADIPVLFTEVLQDSFLARWTPGTGAVHTDPGEAFDLL